MNKIKSFTDNERKEYGLLYGELVGRINNISTILNFDDFNDRQFVKRSEAIRKYLEVLDEADRKASGTGLAEVFKNDNKYKEEALTFKRSIAEDIRTVKKCLQCKCSSCKFNCELAGCRNCKKSEIVYECDRNNNILLHGMEDITLFHHEANREITFEVIGRLIDKDVTAEYIVLEEVDNSDNLQMYRYFTHTSGKVEYLSMSEEEIDKYYEIFIELNDGGDN